MITLYRGFIAKNEKHIYSNGLAILNPRGGSEPGWPGHIGLSFGSQKIFVEDFVKRTYAHSKGIKAVGEIVVSTNQLVEHPILWGVRRIISYNQRDEIEYELIRSEEEAETYPEFLVNPNYLSPTWLREFNTQLGLLNSEGQFTYKPFADFEKNIEGSMNPIEGYLRGFGRR